jgi:hypothetical protein
MVNDMEQTPDELLSELRSVMDEQDETNKRLSDLRVRRDAIEARLIDLHKVTKLTTFANDVLTVNVAPDTMRVGYDPDRWDSIVKFFVDAGRIDVVQRRLSESKILELLDSGAELPDGLKFDGYTKISVRRK